MSNRTRQSVDKLMHASLAPEANFNVLYNLNRNLCSLVESSIDESLLLSLASFYQVVLHYQAADHTLELGDPGFVGIGITNDL
jgi:hypothetical protein